jgi:hypothetical protein
MSTAGALACDGRAGLLMLARPAVLATAGIAADATASVLARTTITTVKIDWIGLMGS